MHIVIVEARQRTAQNMKYNEVITIKEDTFSDSKEYISKIGLHIWTIYTQQKKKVDTLSSLIILYTTSIDGKCHMSYEREIYPL